MTTTDQDRSARLAVLAARRGPDVADATVDAGAGPDRTATAERRPHRRRHVAAAGRVVAAGAAISGTFAMVAVLGAHAEVAEGAPDVTPTDAVASMALPDPVAVSPTAATPPPAPDVTVVVRRHIVLPPAAAPVGTATVPSVSPTPTDTSPTSGAAPAPVAAPTAPEAPTTVPATAPTPPTTVRRATPAPTSTTAPPRATSRATG